MSEPAIIDKNTELDRELCELLGSKPEDFIVLCADGVQVPFTGTPFDSPINRENQTEFCAKLNLSGKGSWWPEMFEGWEPKFRSHYNLAPDATAKTFHPVFSWNISRVCVAYSQGIVAAIQLFEQLKVKAAVARWRIGSGADGIACVELLGQNGSLYCEQGADLPLQIAKAVKRVLADGKKGAE